MKSLIREGITRRTFLKGAVAGVCVPIFDSFSVVMGQAEPFSQLFWIRETPSQPFYDSPSENNHVGVDSLLQLMGDQGLKFYRSGHPSDLSGPSGMIAPDDIVLIKVNAQWKYRGCTNSDLIRGLIQAILDHPDGFIGEVVIFENGQGRGSLNCDTTAADYPDGRVYANANDESHSFLYLVNTIFNDPRVSAYLLDPIRETFIGGNEHVTQGYRAYENVSYPCFTTEGGHRVELREGIWQGSGYTQNLKLINVPVLKHHDTGGSEITASLKHFYGVVSMADGQSPFRHYGGLGETCGKMVVSVRTPVLSIVDAIWVSHSALAGYPAITTFRTNQILASQDPVALDYWAAKYILYPIDNNSSHHPDAPGIDQWLTGARDAINGRQGLYNPGDGILVGMVTKKEREMLTHQFIFSEAISTPATPSGVSDGTPGTRYDYTVDGSSSDLGHGIQYLFDWGDGTDSGWLPVGTTTASKSWGSPGIYGLTAQARCVSQPSVLSLWSASLPVAIIPPSVALQSPAPDQGFDSCSFIAGRLPTFSWTSMGPFTEYSLLCSSSPTDFTAPIVKGRIRSPGNSWTPPKWPRGSLKTMADLSFNDGSMIEIYWKVIGTLPDRLIVESEVRGVHIEAPRPVAIDAPSDGAVLFSSVPPTFNFISNCNLSFTLEFSPLSDFSDSTKIRRLVYKVRNRMTGDVVNWTLPPRSWTAVGSLVGTEIGYFRLKAWDAINRETISEIRSFTLQEGFLFSLPP